MKTDIKIDALEYSSEYGKRNGKLVLNKEILKRLTDKRQKHVYAQFEKLVKPAVRDPEFIFLGLERALYNDNSLEGDNEKLVYVFSPRFDYVWKGSKFDGSIERIKKPNNCVFTVIVSKNNLHKDEYKDVFGFIEEWNWCDSESHGKKPVSWIDRYGKLFFDKNKFSLV